MMFAVQCNSGINTGGAAIASDSFDECVAPERHVGKWSKGWFVEVSTRGWQRAKLAVCSAVMM